MHTKKHLMGATRTQAFNSPRQETW